MVAHKNIKKNILQKGISQWIPINNSPTFIRYLLYGYQLQSHIIGYLLNGYQLQSHIYHVFAQRISITVSLTFIKYLLNG